MEKQYVLFDVCKMRYAVPMKYVEYIIPASGEYPSCVPPKVPSYINRIISIEKRQVAVIELENFINDNAVYQGERPLVLILNCQDKIIGIQTDYITLPPKQSEPELIEDSVNQCAVLKCDGSDFVLFDVPGLLKKWDWEHWHRRKK